MRKSFLSTLLIFTLFLLITTPALAQSYYFVLPTLTVDAYWESDGTLSLDYTYYFENTALRTSHRIC